MLKKMEELKLTSSFLVIDNCKWAGRIFFRFLTGHLANRS